MSILLAAALAHAAGTITFQIENVRNARGKVLVAVCPRAKFLKEDCAYNAEVPAHPGTVRISVHGVPPGDWAAQAFHDENNNEKVDQGLFGIPKEGLAFSNDARITFSAPKWSAAHFRFNGGELTQRIRMRYGIGG